MRRVVTIGTFDLLHQGHLNLLHICAKLAGKDGVVLVGVNGDEFVNKFKGRAPVQDEGTRTALVDALKVVGATYLHDGDTDDFLYRMRGDFTDQNFLVIGSDWAAKDYYAQLGVTRERVRCLGYTLLYVDYTKGVSSTALRTKENL